MGEERGSVWVGGGTGREGMQKTLHQFLLKTGSDNYWSTGGLRGDGTPEGPQATRGPGLPLSL